MCLSIRNINYTNLFSINTNLTSSRLTNKSLIIYSPTNKLIFAICTNFFLTTRIYRCILQGVALTQSATPSAPDQPASSDQSGKIRMKLFFYIANTVLKHGTNGET